MSRAVTLQHYSPPFGTSEGGPLSPRSGAAECPNRPANESARRSRSVRSNGSAKVDKTRLPSLIVVWREKRIKAGKGAGRGRRKRVETASGPREKLIRLDYPRGRVKMEPGLAPCHTSLLRVAAMNVPDTIRGAGGARNPGQRPESRRRHPYRGRADGVTTTTPPRSAEPEAQDLGEVDHRRGCPGGAGVWHHHRASVNGAVEQGDRGPDRRPGQPGPAEPDVRDDQATRGAGRCRRDTADPRRGV